MVPGVGDDAPGETLRIVAERLTALPSFGSATVEELIITAEDEARGHAAATYRTSVAHLEAREAGIGIDMFEMQWSDLSRFPDRLRGFLLTLYGLLLGLPTIGIEALRGVPGRPRSVQAAENSLQAVGWALAVPLLSIHLLTFGLTLGLGIAIIWSAFPVLVWACLGVIALGLGGLAWWGGGRLRDAGFGVWWHPEDQQARRTPAWYVMHPRTWGLTATGMSVALVVWQLGPAARNPAVAIANALMYSVAFPFRGIWIGVSLLVALAAIASATLGLRAFLRRPGTRDTGRAAGTALLSVAAAPLGFAIVSAMVFAAFGTAGFAAVDGRDWKVSQPLVACLNNKDLPDDPRGFLVDARHPDGRKGQRKGCLNAAGRIELTYSVKDRSSTAPIALPCFENGLLSVQAIDRRNDRGTEAEGSVPEQEQIGDRLLCIADHGTLVTRFRGFSPPPGLQCLPTQNSWEPEACTTLLRSGQAHLLDVLSRRPAATGVHPRGPDEQPASSPTPVVPSTQAEVDQALSELAAVRPVSDSPRQWALRLFSVAIGPLGPTVVVVGALLLIAMVIASPLVVLTLLGARRRGGGDGGRTLTRVGNALGCRYTALALLTAALAGTASVVSAWMFGSVPFRDGIGSAKAGGLGAVFTAALLLALRSFVLSPSGLALGKVGGGLEFVRRFLDLGNDVATYLRRSPNADTRAPKRRIMERFDALLDHINRGTCSGAPYDGVVLVAHSQGTILTAATLFGDPWGQHARAAAPGTWSLLTFGSPLGSIYRARFPMRYQWVRAEMEAPGTFAPLTGSWVNLYCAGDYVGRSLWASDGAWDPTPPGTIKDGPPTLVEGCIGRGGHTGYWGNDVVTNWLLRLVAEAAGREATALGGAPPIVKGV